MSVIVLDYKASVPSNSFGGTAPVPIPQIPSQLQVADLGLFIPQVSPATTNNRVYLSADVSISAAVGSLFNNGVIFRIYRDGVEIFNTLEGVQRAPASPTEYNVTFSTVDENVPSGFHVYKLVVQAIIANNAPAVFTIAQVIGPVTFSGLAVGTT
ncbi:exosporium protein C [Aneurinibacillus sp. REN35]|uniref:exosporium protein C n=1 Tax=Aneurinibacillus sp. REN35 TaxID=3237286 RepID=UPI00352774E0